LIPLTFCDVATFYCRSGGGIRTYYNAKLDWFQRQSDHRYVLVIPGRRSSMAVLSPTVTIVEVRGIGISRVSDGYRLFSDLSYIRDAVRRFRPDVLEAGDPWMSGPIALLCRHDANRPRVVSSFFHSDPIPTYVEPFLRRMTSPRVAHRVSRAAGCAFSRLQASYDVTMVGSSALGDRLRHEGVTRVLCTPFGVDERFFEIGRRRLPIAQSRHLLYAGRLDREKQVDLLLAVLPRLLERTGVSVTVAGNGAFRSEFERLRHPRFRYAGYVREPDELAALYAGHDIFVAPGAHETFGLAALEAAASGLLIVGPDQGGVGSLLHEMGSPFSFRAGDPESLLATLMAALEADWPRASAASRALAARYGTWSNAIARLVGTYERLIEVGRG
jgi:alpha-1,6-mannosyltransferase